MIKIILMVGLFVFAPISVQAHNNDDVKVTKVKVTDTIYMIQAGGGNIGVSIGLDDLFVIDSSVVETSDQVLEMIKTISDKPIKILANTHWHFDHAGGNKKFNDHGAVIIGHHNIHPRMKKGGTIEAFGKVVEPADQSALPRITHEGKTLVHVGDESIELISVDPAHTDGDSFVYWPKSNVLHTGDLFFNGFYPFIDASSNGSLQGMIMAVEKMLSIVNENTKIIPGHGPMATTRDLKVYLEMLKFVSQSISDAKAAGKTQEQWTSSNPLQSLETEWGDGFLPTEKFMDIAWAVSE